MTLRIFSPAARARAAGDEMRSVIAGYHWFTDWGRDTMISLEGLTISTGRRVEGTVIALGSTPAPVDHHVVRLSLADGRAVDASPGHPLADGRQIGEIQVGDVVDGSRVSAAELLPYAGGETFDLVASGDTGAYFAGGIPMGSTLLPRS